MLSSACSERKTLEESIGTRVCLLKIPLNECRGISFPAPSVFVSELSVLVCFSSKVFRVFFGIDHRLGLEHIGEEMRPRNSLKGVGVSGQSFTQRPGMLSADIDISLKKGGL